MPSPAGPRPNLPRYAGFAAVIAAAGIPLYIHLPAYLATRYGIRLETLGSLLLALRLLDFAQDPALGWILSRLGRLRELAVGAAALLLGAGMVGLFAVPAPVTPLVWVVACLILTFTGFSMLSIQLYSDGVARGATAGHVRVATWREAGALIGITTACLLPFTLPGDGFRGFAVVFALGLAAAAWGMRGRWIAAPRSKTPLGKLFRDPVARRFLLLAFLNATPVAVTSTLFVFFVEARLGLPEQTGLFLVLFFVSAAASTAGWRYLAGRFGAQRALGAGMSLAIASFIWAYTLQTGDGLAFALISVASGAALGADMLLLPALFSAHQARSGGDQALAFGFWTFVGKATLALAAGLVLPTLAWAGFDPSGPRDPAAVDALAFLYAVVPCALKAGALALLFLAFDDEDVGQPSDRREDDALEGI